MVARGTSGDTSMTDRASRRVYDRIDTVFRVDYRTVDRFFADFAENISEGGMFISTTRPLDPGSVISIEFNLPFSEEPLRVEAEVIWVRKRSINEKERRGMGVRFRALGPDEKRRISAIVSSLRRVP